MTQYLSEPETDGVSSDSDEETEDPSPGPRVDPARSREVMNQLREYGESLHRERLEERRRRESNQNGPVIQDSSDSSVFTSESNDDSTSHACVTQDGEIAHPTRNLRGEASDLRNFLLDSGASSHFTPYLEDLEDIEDCEVEVFLADGSAVRASKMGTLTLKFKSKEDIFCTLKLRRVLWVDGLKQRLFSIPSFVSNSKFSVNFEGSGTTLHFGDGTSFTVPSNTFKKIETSRIQIDRTPQVIENTKTTDQEPELVSTSPINDDLTGKKIIPTTQGVIQDNRVAKSLEYGQKVIMRSIRPLLSGSLHKVWEDYRFIASPDS